jgi:hypothetical protein
MLIPRLRDRGQAERLSSELRALLEGYKAKETALGDHDLQGVLAPVQLVLVDRSSTGLRTKPNVRKCQIK